jgi:ABC-type sugar transport system permease subunit
VILFVLVTGIISGFQVFTLVYLMTEGGPLHSTDVLVYRIYQTAWEFLRFGYASAMAVVLFLILLVVTVVQFRLLGRRVEYV